MTSLVLWVGRGGEATDSCSIRSIAACSFLLHSVGTPSLRLPEEPIAPILSGRTAVWVDLQGCHVGHAAYKHGPWIKSTSPMPWS